MVFNVKTLYDGITKSDTFLFSATLTLNVGVTFGNEA